MSAPTSTNAVKTIAAIRKVAASQKIAERAIKAKNFPLHLKAPLRGLLAMKENLSVEYFVTQAERLVAKGWKIYNESGRRIRQANALRKRAVIRKEELLALLTGGAVNQLAINVQLVQDLIAMFDRFLTGQKAIPNPRREEDVIIFPEEFLTQTEPIYARLKDAQARQARKNQPCAHTQAA